MPSEGADDVSGREASAEGAPGVPRGVASGSGVTDGVEVVVGSGVGSG